MENQNTSFLRKYPLSKKKPLVETIKKPTVLVILIAYVPLLLVSLFAIQPAVRLTLALVLSLTFFGIIGIIYLYQYIYYKNYFYNITDKHVIIRKGLFARQEINIPLDKIQDVYVDQDVWDKIFDIYDVHISTTTALSGQRAHIDGVSSNTAKQLRKLILKAIS